MKYTITILNDDTKIEVEEGTVLLDAMNEADHGIDAPCGGKGQCKKCKVLIDGEEKLACQTKVEKDILVMLPNKTDNTILTEGIVATTVPDGTNKYVLAYDIGTTTVVAYLLNGETGEQLSIASILNPQTTYGGDVVSRIQHQNKEGGTDLRDCIRSAMQTIAKEAVSKAGLSVEDVTLVTMVGNTAMHHLMMGIDVHTLVTPPYMPNVYDAITADLHEILPIFPKGEFRALPNIAGFVGADTVGCMLATRFDTLEKYTLMIDIGTNGEMVIGNKDRRICCSTAAGPAFEGAKISQGMRGATGAIDHAKWVDDHLEYHIIGEDVPAVGICGSGILDITKALIDAGIVNWRGKLEGKEYKIPGTEVTVTQMDIREIQLAKSAIRSGIDLLIKTLGIETDQIEDVFLAGAFGNYMSPDAACAIGMIPPVLLPKIKSIGNAAGEGSKLAALNKEEFEYAQRLHDGCEFIELASLPEFMNCYTSNLNFPKPGADEDDD